MPIKSKCWVEVSSKSKCLNKSSSKYNKPNELCQQNNRSEELCQQNSKNNRIEELCHQDSDDSKKELYHQDSEDKKADDLIEQMRSRKLTNKDMDWITIRSKDENSSINDRRVAVPSETWHGFENKIKITFVTNNETPKYTTWKKKYPGLSTCPHGAACPFLYEMYANVKINAEVIGGCNYYHSCSEHWYASYFQDLVLAWKSTNEMPEVSSSSS